MSQYLSVGSARQPGYPTVSNFVHLRRRDTHLRTRPYAVTYWLDGYCLGHHADWGMMLIMSSSAGSLAGFSLSA